MKSVSAGHIILTPTQPGGSGRPQRHRERVRKRQTDRQTERQRYPSFNASNQVMDKIDLEWLQYLQITLYIIQKRNNAYNQSSYTIEACPRKGESRQNTNSILLISIL